MFMNGERRTSPHYEHTMYKGRSIHESIEIVRLVKTVKIVKIIKISSVEERVSLVEFGSLVSAARALKIQPTQRATKSRCRSHHVRRVYFGYDLVIRVIAILTC